MATGLFVEYLIVHSADHSIPYYTYDASHFVEVGGIPLWVGVGWGLVMYSATWTAEQWTPSWLGRALVAGVLAVNLDVSLEPAGLSRGYWAWIWPETMTAHAFSYYGIPLDNFTGWFGIVATYGLFTRTAVHLADRELASRIPALWVDVLVVPLASSAGVVALALMRAPVVALYGAAGPDARGHLFVLLALLGAATFALVTGRCPRHSAKTNPTVLVLVVFFHGLSLLLLARSASSPGWLVPLTAVFGSGAGVTAFAWPLVERIFDAGSRSRERRWQRLTSYAGVESYGEVVAPASAEELRETLRRARAQGRMVTFRGAGNAFDSQALSRDLAISLERFTGIAVDERRATVTVGAGARWGEIVEETARHGLLPHVLVTTRQATAGGTLSAHSISRFTPTLGREGGSVRSFRMMLLDGSVVLCSRTENPDIFGATIGGLGYVGAVLEITYDLMRAPCRSNDIGIETTFVKLTGVESLCEHLLRDARDEAFVAESEDPWTAARAISAVVYLRGARHSLVALSRYCDRRTTNGPRCSFHAPRSLAHVALQIAAQISVFREWGYRVVFNGTFREPRTFVDGLFGYTFFQDGNQRVRRWGRSAGFAMGIRQQTYMIPCDRIDVAGSARTLDEFLERSQALLDRAGLLPALVDLLYVPADRAFPLSSSHRLSSFAVTYTFEKLTSSLFPDEELVCRELAMACAQMGGRVHLVKQVFAEARETETTYEGGVAALRRVRARIHASQVLSNEFLERVLPSLAAPGALDAPRAPCDSEPAGPGRRESARCSTVDVTSGRGP